MNKKEFCVYISNFALKALLYEVSATPKPGLVDRNNSGAHKDMDFFTFMSSSAAIAGTFLGCAKVGTCFEGDDYTLLLKKIRPLGIEGEKRMFQATNDVNTHKGLIFSLGIISAAAGSLFKSEGNYRFNADELCSRVKEMTKNISENELSKNDLKKDLTYGELLYQRYGIRGIRGEVESGFETVRKISLPLLNRYLEEKKYHINDILVNVLINLMANTEDSNILGRHDLDALTYVKEKGKKAIELGGSFTREGKKYIEELDREFIEMNISPGGSADLLAVTLMLYMIENGDIV